MSTKAEKKRDRARKRLLDEAKTRQNARDVMARRDGLEQQGYERKNANMRIAWDKNVENLKRITDGINQNQALKDRWVKLGRI